MSLSEVLTIQEVSKFWGKHRTTVRYHIDRGNLRARYTAAGRILVEKDSVITLWGPPVQEINDVRELELGIEYYEASDERDIEKIVRDFVRPFDLGKSPLLRVGLINSQNEINLLMVDVHHIAADGVSHDILVKDFISLYLGKELSRLRLQYKDFSEWQNREKVKEEIKQQEAYWLKEFEGEIPILNCMGIRLIK